MVEILSSESSLTVKFLIFKSFNSNEESFVLYYELTVPMDFGIFCKYAIICGIKPI